MSVIADIYKRLFALKRHLHLKDDIEDFAHLHDWIEVNGLMDLLDSRAFKIHTHEKTDITDFAHTHAAANISVKTPDIAHTSGSVQTHIDEIYGQTADLYDKISEKVSTVNNVKPDENGNVTISVGSNGTTNYNDLSNKPSINGVTLSGNKTTQQLGLAPNSHVGDATHITADERTKWNGKSDFGHKHIAADINVQAGTDPIFSAATLQAHVAEIYKQINGKMASPDCIYDANSNAYYCKWPNGILEMWGIKEYPADGSDGSIDKPVQLTFPISFVNTNYYFNFVVEGRRNSDNSLIMALGTRYTRFVCDKDTAYIKFGDHQFALLIDNGHAPIVNWHAIGKWK